MTNNPKNQFATKEDLKKLGTGIGKNIRGFKDEIRGDIKEYKDELKGYMGLLHERFSDQVKVVAEQYTTIDKRLIRVESKTDILTETVGEIKMEMTEMKEDMTELKTDVSELKTDVSELKTDMKEVKEELLPKSIKRIGKLEHRVVVLESKA